MPTGMLYSNLSVLVLRTATAPSPGVSARVESTASAYRPLQVNATGPASGAWLSGKMPVTGTKDSTLPVATSTTDMPPIPNTQARVPSGVNAIDETGPDCVTGIVCTIFCADVLTTQTSPDSTLPTQTSLLSGVVVAVCAPAGSLTVLTRLPLLVRTTATVPADPLDCYRVTYAYSPALVPAATISVAPAPTLIVLMTFRVLVLSTFTTFRSKVAM